MYITTNTIKYLERKDFPKIGEYGVLYCTSKGDVYTWNGHDYDITHIIDLITDKEGNVKDSYQ